MVHVPYRGASPAVSDLIGGQIMVMFGIANSVVPHIKSGAIGRPPRDGGASRDPLRVWSHVAGHRHRLSQSRCKKESENALKFTKEQASPERVAPER